MTKNALFVDYEYCTGCHACEEACLQEHGYANKEANGIIVYKMGPTKTYQEAPEFFFNYVPVPTDLCDLCADRVESGKLPTCVHHCQARCLEYGGADELIKKAATPKTAVFVVK